MSGVSWVLAVSLLMTMAALFIVLVGGTNSRARLTLVLSAREREIRELTDENANLRRARLTVVHPATRDRMDKIRGVIAANEAGRWDSEWEQFNGGDSA